MVRRVAVHRPGCRCVGCSAETRAKGTKALRAAAERRAWSRIRAPKTQLERALARRNPLRKLGGSRAPFDLSEWRFIASGTREEITKAAATLQRAKIPTEEREAVERGTWLLSIPKTARSDARRLLGFSGGRRNPRQRRMVFGEILQLKDPETGMTWAAQIRAIDQDYAWARAIAGQHADLVLAATQYRRKAMDALGERLHVFADKLAQRNPRREATAALSDMAGELHELTGEVAGIRQAIRGNPRRASGRYSPAARRFLGGEIPALIREGMPPVQATAAAMSMARRQGLKVPAKMKTLFRSGNGRNPLTRAETATVLREARSARTLALRTPREKPRRAYLAGMSEGQEWVARKFGVTPREYSIMRKVPLAANPRKTSAATSLVWRDVFRDATGQEAMRFTLDLQAAGFKHVRAINLGLGEWVVKIGVVPGDTPGMLRLQKLLNRLERKYGENPPAARIAATLPASRVELRYRRHGAHAGHYFHRFGKGTKVYGLANGSVLIRGARRAWTPAK